MYSLKDDKSIKIKGADKGEAVIVWNREDYLKEVGKELKDKEVHVEVPNKPNALVFKSLEKIRKCGYLSQETQLFLSKRRQICEVLLIT